MTTTELYIREAEAIREGFGEVFPALPANCRPIATGRIGKKNIPKYQVLRERDTGLEPATFGLGSRRSTN